MKTNHIRIMAVILVAGLLATALPSNGELLIYEPFDIEGSELAGNGSGFGWGTPTWEHVVEGQISVGDGMAFANLVTTGGAAVLVGPYLDNRPHSISRYISYEGSAGSTVWASYVWQTGASSNGVAMNDTQLGWTNGGFVIGDGSHDRFQVAVRHVAHEVNSLGGYFVVGNGMGIITDTVVNTRSNPSDLYAPKFLILVRVTGSGTITQTGTLWALTEENFTTLIESGWDETVLDNPANYAQRDEYTNTNAVGEVAPPRSNYVRIDYKESGGSLFDELRIGSTLESVTPIYAQEPPSIVTQPQSVEVQEELSASFSVEAEHLPVTYQWRFNGEDIQGATKATYNIDFVEPGDAGDYTVFITSSGGTVESDAATLTVIPSVVDFIAHPQSQWVSLGDSVDLTVEAEGNGLTYQWHFNGVDIDGATDAVYTIANAEFSHSGTYSVSVTNTEGTAHSRPAELEVIEKLQFLTQPEDKVVTYGESFFVSTSAQGEQGTAIRYRWYLNDVPHSQLRSASYLLLADFSHEGVWKIEAVETGGHERSVFSDPYTVTVLSPSGLPHSLADAAGFGDEYFESDWFGQFFFDAAFGNWIYSTVHGWLYVVPNQSVGTMWYWESATESWWYASSSMSASGHAYFYSLEYGWMLFDRVNSTIARRYFFRFSMNEWIELNQ